MSTTQLNAEFYRNMSIIAEDEALTKKLMKYDEKADEISAKIGRQQTGRPYADVKRGTDD